jgi:phage FluMu protein Com
MNSKHFSEEDWRRAAEALQSGGMWDIDSFRDWLGWVETQEMLRQRYGDGWTLDDALQYIKPTDAPPASPRTTRAERKRARGFGARPTRENDGDDSDQTVLVNPQDIIGAEEFNRRVEDVVKKYVSHYTDIAPNDLSAIRDMASAEVAMEIVNQLMAAEMHDPQAVSRYNYALKLLSERARAIQKMLGIDRSAREQVAREQSDADKAIAVISEAGAWVESQMLMVYHCDILLGMFWTDFKEIEWHITSKCPRCGDTVEFVHIPSEEDLRAKEPEWVAREEAEYRQRELTALVSDVENDTDVEGEDVAVG